MSNLGGYIYTECGCSIIHVLHSAVRCCKLESLDAPTPTTTCSRSPSSLHMASLHEREAKNQSERRAPEKTLAEEDAFGAPGGGSSARLQRASRRVPFCMVWLSIRLQLNDPLRVTPNNGKFKNPKIWKTKKRLEIFFFCDFPQNCKNRFLRFYEKLKFRFLQFSKKCCLYVFCMFEGCLKGFTTIKTC